MPLHTVDEINALIMICDDERGHIGPRHGEHKCVITVHPAKEIGKKQSDEIKHL
jgi:hypothetical protein